MQSFAAGVDEWSLARLEHRATLGCHFTRSCCWRPTAGSSMRARSRPRASSTRAAPARGRTARRALVDFAATAPPSCMSRARCCWSGGTIRRRATAEKIDLNLPAPDWQSAGTMAHRTPPAQCDGASRRHRTRDRRQQRRRVQQRWCPALHSRALGSAQPAENAFTTLASATRYRGYHSIALLLPDGRVLSSGGDNEPNAEVFSPPYLFKGARPAVTPLRRVSATASRSSSTRPTRRRPRR